MEQSPLLEIRSNLHTHTSFSDGKQCAEEVVLSAIEEGMEVIGFSEHSHNRTDGVYGMRDEATATAYRTEILRLRECYGDRICILLGLEQDSHGEPAPHLYDYTIGSVHYVLVNGEYCAVDYSRERTERTVREHFGGDFYRYTKAYYEEVAQLAKKTECDIIGHFDLVTKFNEGNCMFLEQDVRYLRPALEALDALIEQDVIFEINTGAISRGYRKTPYPSIPILSRLVERDAAVTLSADAHHKDHLTYGFEQAVRLLQLVGMRSVLTMTQNGWKQIHLK